MNLLYVSLIIVNFVYFWVENNETEKEVSTQNMNKRALQIVMDGVNMYLAI